jgi:predicted phage terminase large subunit-like protein
MSGELMHPARWGPAQVAEAKGAGLRRYLAHHQQDPEGSGGTLFNDTWWKTYGQVPALDGFRRIIQSWDMRFKDDKESGSYVVGQVWGLAWTANVFLLDEVRGRWSFEETKEAFVGLCAKWPQARTKLIENKANGPAIYSALRALTFGLILVDVQGSKLSRAENHTGTAKAGNIWLPAETLSPWITDWRSEATHFPSEPDDRIDAATQAWDFLVPRVLAEDPRTQERKQVARRRQLQALAQRRDRVTASRTGF